jgi:hypothetical protein
VKRAVFQHGADPRLLAHALDELQGARTVLVVDADDPSARDVFGGAWVDEHRHGRVIARSVPHGLVAALIQIFVPAEVDLSALYHEPAAWSCRVVTFSRGVFGHTEIDVHETAALASVGGPS